MFELIPQPRELRRTGRDAEVGSIALGALPASLDAHRAEIERLLAGVGGGAAVQGGRAVSVEVREAEHPAEGYGLTVEDGAVTVEASDARGALYAVRTLIEMLAQTWPALPGVEIVDRPGFAQRGVFVESFSSTDRMTFDDWRALIDRFAQLKLNVLSISLYGCWDLRHDGDRCEYVFAKLPSFPDLRSPQRMRTWDPEAGREVVLEYLPAMYEDPTLWGRIVAYGRRVGVDVVAVWGGPAHSSLLPRTVPALSALDADGTRKEYGYCVTGETSRATIRQVLREVIETHLTPHGVDLLAIGGDEYYPIVNVHPDDPLRSVAPTCECEGCRGMAPGDQLIEFLVLAAHELAAHGVRAEVYADSLVREDVFDRFLARFDAEGLTRPIIVWWSYVDPIHEITEAPETSWAMPTTGVVNSLFLQDVSDNIEAWVDEGARVGSLGVVAYNMPDPAFHKNYACLADLSWNREGSGGARGFHERWAARVAPDATSAALRAYTHGERVVGSQPLMVYLLDHLLTYFATSPHGVNRFPDDVVRNVSVAVPAIGSLLRQTANTARVSADRMPETRTIEPWPDPATSWRAEMRRMADHVDLFCDLVELARRLHEEELDALEPEIAALEVRGTALLADIAAAKPGFLAPATLREHWYVIGEIRPMLERMAADPDLRPSARPNWHAWIF